jgi:Flp pilus assembly pilin Flp
MASFTATVAGLTYRVAGWRLAFVAWATQPPPDQGDRQLGQGLAEYALILALVAISVIAALTFMGAQISAVLVDPISAEIGKVIDLIT